LEESEDCFGAALKADAAVAVADYGVEVSYVGFGADYTL
jgi:hypothetical protein